MAFYPEVPVDDSKIERLLTLCSYYDKIYDEADKLYFSAESMDKRDVSKSIATIREYDDKVYQLTGESLVSREVSLLSYSYETESVSNVFDIILRILSIVLGAILTISSLRLYFGAKNARDKIMRRVAKDKESFLLSVPKIFPKETDVWHVVMSFNNTCTVVLDIFNKHASEVVDFAKSLLNGCRANIAELDKVVSSPGYKTTGALGDDANSTSPHADKANRAFVKFKFHVSWGTIARHNTIYLTDLQSGNSGVVLLSAATGNITAEMRNSIDNIDHVEKALANLKSGDLDTIGILKNIIVPVRFKSSEKIDVTISKGEFESMDDYAKKAMSKIEGAIKNLDRMSSELASLNKEVKSHIERLSKIEINQADRPWVRSILNDVREAGKYTTGIVSDLHVIVKGLRIKPYY